MKQTSKLLSLALSGAMLLGLLASCSDAGTQPSPSAPAGTPQANPTPAPIATPAPPTSDAADLILKNGTIQTLVSEDDVHQAVAIRGNEIVYVGDDAGAEAFVGDGTQVIDLDGKFVSPGFMDGHLHGPQPWYEKMFTIYLAGKTTNEEYLAEISKFVNNHPEMEVYYGGSFMLNAYKLPDGTNPGPNKADLDAICSDKPIIIKDVSNHARWVNSKALEIAGVTKDTPDPQGGLIGRDENGEPTGYLADAAANLVTNVIKIDYDENYAREAWLAYLKEVNAMGITGMTDINLAADPDLYLDVCSQLDQEGLYTLRSRYITWASSGATYEDVKAHLERQKELETEHIKTGTVKISLDGVTEGATAYMLEPYSESAGKGAGWYGDPYWDTAEFQEIIRKLDADEYQIHVHAIGDAAVHETLDALQAAQDANGQRDARHTITHVCAITPDDVQRMADLDVVAALQFAWMYRDSLCQLEEDFIGMERAHAMYPAKNMFDAGCVIAGASDGAVTTYNPLEEIEVGVTRNSPFPGEEDTDMHRWAEQALTPYQMLEIYTKNVAYENFMDDEIGTIEVGKKADLVVLGQNILTCDPKTISDTQVCYTIADGKIVYTNP